MEKVVRVRISEFEVAGAPAVLKISGLGSCVALALYDPLHKIGGLAHILLPGPAPLDADGPGSNLSTTKYADRAIKQLLEAMAQRGIDLSRLVAKIAGGANMFTPDLEPTEEMCLRSGVGERNVAAVKEQLDRLAIPLVAEDVGGNRGRTVCFETDSGQLRVINARGEARVL